ncbi:MAG: VWA domain-containing protein [Candidatus Cloacimonetes bacterium]|nr:VWA domain-containing protein [Candidatus Cloacimonadota bacterium]MBS3766609.1 VWA domain-containing protein [Candidatus Cloacimonadota bacterium]
MNITFLNPEFFWLLLIIPVFALYEIFVRTKKKPTLLFSDIGDIKSSYPSQKNYFYYIGHYIFKLLFIFCLVLILARPVIPEKLVKIDEKGVDIILTLDVSTSMRAIDFKPKNRLYVAKEEAKNFIDSRTNDRVGLVIFGGKSYTQCPLTIDHNILKTLLEQIKTGMVEDGTAIGMGLATSINRLRDSKAKSKVIILLTDGRNNAGEMDPITAAQLAKELGIKIYTIAVGKEGESKILVDHPIYGKQYVTQNLDIDMESLNKIAELGNTSYARRARNSKELKQVLTEIDKLEKTKVSEKIRYRYYEIFYYFVYVAIALFILDIIFSRIILARIP